jgi:hypothetical protein
MPIERTQWDRGQETLAIRPAMRELPTSDGTALQNGLTCIEPDGCGPVF